MRAFTFLLVVLTLLSCSTKDEAETDSPASSAYFAVGQDGAIVTSQDGSTWRLLQSGTTNSFREIAYGGGRLLTVGDNATAVYSEDFGNTWKASNALGGFSSESFDGAYFVNDKYFITTWGGKGSLLTSSDAISWVEQDNFSSTTGYYKIVFGNNNYLAVGDNGSVQLSPDMGDWREYNAVGNINFYDVIYCKGVYVTVGSNDGFTGGGISWSDTGLTWNSANHVILATNPLYGVTCGENEMIVVGQSGLILKSIDGKDWSVTGAGVTNNALFHAVYANSRYLVVGDNGTVVTSNDHGETWTASSMGIEKWFGSIIYAEK